MDTVYRVRCSNGLILIDTKPTKDGYYAAEAHSGCGSVTLLSNKSVEANIREGERIIKEHEAMDRNKQRVKNVIRELLGEL